MEWNNPRGEERMVRRLSVPPETRTAPPVSDLPGWRPPTLPQATADRILSHWRDYREEDFDMDPSLLQLAHDALRARGTDSGHHGALRRQLAGRPLSVRQAVHALNAIRREIRAARPRPQSQPKQHTWPSSDHPAASSRAPGGDCKHHWKIPEPDGRRKLPAVCAICGAERTFSVSLPDPKPSTKEPKP
jgi:hypothetical protein